MNDHVQINRENWDERAPAHAASPDYAVQRLIEDPGFLSGVVRFDLPRLGDIRGLDCVHLQCHIATDTISLARLGARVTGLDFSAQALAEARRLADATGTALSLVESELHDALEHLQPHSFDLVYTGIGAICWLPEIGRWAQIVAGLLRPGGRLFIRDVHPMLGALELEAGALQLCHPYFERPQPTVSDYSGTYVETDVSFVATRSALWNHGLAEIVSALLAAGLQLTALEEHDCAPWNALPGLMSVDAAGEWRLSERPERLAATFTLQARSGSGAVAVG